MSVRVKKLAGIKDSSGQMCVEFAVLTPVCIAVALIIYNLAAFAIACARFDRISSDVIVAHGSSAQKSAGQESVEKVLANIEQAMGVDQRISIEVEAHPAGVLGSSNFSLLPSTTCFSCTLRFALWPHAFSLAGVSFWPPVYLQHEHSLVVDCV